MNAIPDYFFKAAYELSVGEHQVEDLYRVCRRITQLILEKSPKIVGLSGPPGSGKTTVSSLVARILEKERQLTAVGLSLDNFYLTLENRWNLVEKVHPLLITRGVPGTHDVDLGIATMQSLLNAEADTVTPLPEFDKASDDRKPKDMWKRNIGKADLILFEGWCVGAKPVSEDSLKFPVNRLEASTDLHGHWRKFWNEQLKGSYKEWFDLIDCLIFFAAPSFERVLPWRIEQEQKLADRHPKAPALMSEERLKVFIQNYERLTRHMLKTMPEIADDVIYLDHHRRPLN